LELEAPRRRAARWMLVAAAALLVAVGLAVVALTTRDSAGVTRPADDSVGLIDPATGRLTADYRVGSTPTDVLARGNVAWAINADSETISRVDSSGSRDLALPGPPADLAWAYGSLWVSYSDFAHNHLSFGVERVSPDRLTPAGQVSAPGREFA